MRCCLLLATLALAGLGACATHASAPPSDIATKAAPAQPTPPPDPTVGYLGHWTFTSQMGGESYSGTLDVSRDSAGWHAKLVEATRGEVPLTSVTVDAKGLKMIGNVGDPVTVEVVLQPDGVLAGKVLVGEMEGTVTAKKP